MSEHTNIEWTDHTFNPWVGCTKVSPGCAHCYACVRLRDRKGGEIAEFPSDLQVREFPA